MARMYPAQVSPLAQHGEKLVYEALSTMPEDWVVFHNVTEHYRAGDDYVNYEADFVVLVPNRGFVVIEVKDWSHARIVHGVWQCKGRFDTDSWISMGSKTSPLHQANIARNRLAKGLVAANVISPIPQQQPEHRCMAVLTNSVPPNFDEAANEDIRLSRRNNLPLDSLYLCGEDALFNHLQERIESLFVRRNKLGKYMSPAAVDAITDYLAPSVTLQLDLGNYMNTMERAAGNIFDMLPMLHESTGGILTEGAAGTGKTVMAPREMQRLATTLPADKSLLMLCYNNNLSNSLQDAIPQEGVLADITISSIHNFLIDHIIRPAGREDLILYDGNTPYLNEDGFAQILQQQMPLPRFDYIFVDEAQDFKDIWWKIIRGMLRPDGKFYIFADSNQDLYHRSAYMPQLPTRLRLTTNLRNANEIADFSATMLPQEQRPQSLPFNGAKMLIAPGCDDAEMRAAYVSGFIKKIKTETDIAVRNRDIVVLSPWRHTNERCSLRYADELDYALGSENAEETRARHARCAAPDAEKILADTIKTFKGLEAPYIILTDVQDEHESKGFCLSDFYVACTRAKFGLYIVPTVAGERMIRRFTAELSTAAKA